MAIIRCNCTHEFQDKTHGRQNRVHNRCGKEQRGGWRCTVCGNEKESGAMVIERRVQK